MRRSFFSTLGLGTSMHGFLAMICLSTQKRSTAESAATALRIVSGAF
jgi:hypothetical protein